ncbi:MULTISPECIES: hypothetical protein [Streptomyces]|uniref:hypothetical protein n=1 Tax=Streptomyces TaxID=1883 RepID=UPI001F5E9866
MSEGTLWSTDLGGPLHIDTDANPDLWGYLHVQVDKKIFKEWLDLHLTGLATIHGIELTRKLRRFHKSFYEEMRHAPGQGPGRRGVHLLSRSADLHAPRSARHPHPLRGP